MLSLSVYLLSILNIQDFMKSYIAMQDYVQQILIKYQ